MNNIKKHGMYYGILLLVCGVGVGLLLQKGLTHDTRTIIAISLGLFYSIWGILHHVTHHNTSVKVVLEYVLVGLLGFLVINFLIQSV